MTKIVKCVAMYGESFATFNSYTDEVCYDEDLDKFPAFRDYCLEHEMKHAAKKDDLLWHMQVDFIDYFKMVFKRDVYEFRKYKEKKLLAGKAKDWKSYIIYVVFQVAMGLLLLPVRIVMEYYFLLRRKENYINKL